MSWLNKSNCESNADQIVIRTLREENMELRDKLKAYENYNNKRPQVNEELLHRISILECENERYRLEALKNKQDDECPNHYHVALEVARNKLYAEQDKLKAQCLENENLLSKIEKQEIELNIYKEFFSNNQVNVVLGDKKEK